MKNNKMEVTQFIREEFVVGFVKVVIRPLNKSEFEYEFCIKEKRGKALHD